MNNLSTVSIPMNDISDKSYNGLRIKATRVRPQTVPEFAPAPTPTPAPAPAPAPTPTPTFSFLRAAGGAVIGASVPVAVFAVSHTIDVEGSFSSLILWAAVLGGLVFSAGTVYQLCTRLFSGARGKAAAYCVLSESIMTFAPPTLLPLSLVMLTILVSVNAIQTGRVAGGGRG